MIYVLRKYLNNTKIKIIYIKILILYYKYNLTYIIKSDN